MMTNSNAVQGYICNDEDVTQVIPRETMVEARASGIRSRVEWGEGHQPIGPDRPTRDLRPLRADTDVEDLSDGIPEIVDDLASADTLPRAY